MHTGNTTSNSPFVSFVLITYNQAPYIKEAVEGALAQDFENIEIIISDDHSTDNTFLIIQDCIKKYNGNKKVILNRNEINLGLISNLNKAMSIANGVFIVIASGDDISLPHRSRKLVEKWQESNSLDYVLLHSLIRTIDKDGHLINRTFQHKYIHDLKNPFEILKNGQYALGATIAYPKSLFDFYGPIKSGILNEDTVMSFRASLRDGIIFVKDCLIDYRLNVGIGTLPDKISSKEGKFYIKKKNAEYYLALIEQHIQDFNKSGIKCIKIEKLLLRKSHIAHTQTNAFNKSFFFNLTHLFSSLGNRVPIKLILFSLLLSFFKRFGFTIIPQKLLN